MLPIQRSPLGLLELLSLKGSGDTPRALAEYLQGTLDLNQLYLAPLRRTLNTTTVTITGNGNWAATTAVPAGELWLVTNISYQTAALLGAGEAYRLVPAIFWGGSLNNAEALGQAISWVATDRPAAGYPLPAPVLCSPGVQFGMQVISVSTGATAFPMNVHYYRLAF